MNAATEPNDPAPALLDKAALVKMLQCSAKTIDRMRARGEFPPPVYLGRLCRWPRAAIEAWVAAGCGPVDRPPA